MSDPIDGRSTTAGAAALSAAVGGMIAVLADLVQKEQASAIVQLTTAVNQFSEGFAIPVGGMGLLLVVLAVGMSFVMQPSNRFAAFYTGASIITVVMTGIPYDRPPPIEVIEDLTGTEIIEPSAFKTYPHGIRKPVFPVEKVQQDGRIPVIVTVSGPADKWGPNSVLEGKLFDKVSGRTWELNQGAAKTRRGGGQINFIYKFYVDASEPVNGTFAHLYVRVEADGYTIGKAQKKVTRLGQPVELNVTLEPSNLPVWLQRTMEAPDF